MKRADITQLLERFYAGTTTPEDERRLEAWFLDSDDAADGLSEDRALFHALHAGRHCMPEGVSVRLEATLRSLAASGKQGQMGRKHALWYWAGSAAVVALLCAGLFFATHDGRQPVLTDTCDSPEEAALVAGKTLLYVAATLNRGIEQTAVAGREVERMNEVLNQTLKTNTHITPQ
jgi:hypothetical protein